MAETLGSLVDKLTIKSIREFHLKKALRLKKTKSSQKERRLKLLVVRKQKNHLLREIQEFVALASRGGIVLKEEKVKLYNKPRQIGRIPPLRSVSKAIEALSRKNLELWHLEDEARREDVPLSYIGRIKRKIDLANQQRNDLIDKIDDLLQKSIRKVRKRGV